MAGMDQEHDPLHHSEEEGAKKRKVIWRTFIILFIITALEFLIAGLWLEKAMAKNVLFIGMTLVKAFFIVWEFMHLGHEQKGLKMTIAIPMIFVVWLIIALLVEGAWYDGGWLAKFLPA